MNSPTMLGMMQFSASTANNLEIASRIRCECDLSDGSQKVIEWQNTC